MLWDVVIVGFQSTAAESRATLERSLGLSPADADAFVRNVPRVAGPGLERDEAEGLAARFRELGARVAVRPHADASRESSTDARAATEVSSAVGGTRSVADRRGARELGARPVIEREEYAERESMERITRSPIQNAPERAERINTGRRIAAREVTERSTHDDDDRQSSESIERRAAARNATASATRGDRSSESRNDSSLDIATRAALAMSGGTGTGSTRKRAPDNANGEAGFGAEPMSERMRAPFGDAVATNPFDRPPGTRPDLTRANPFDQPPATQRDLVRPDSFDQPSGLQRGLAQPNPFDQAPGTQRNLQRLDAVAEANPFAQPPSTGRDLHPFGSSAGTPESSGDLGGSFGPIQLDRFPQVSSSVHNVVPLPGEAPKPRVPQSAMDAASAELDALMPAHMRTSAQTQQSAPKYATVPEAAAETASAAQTVRHDSEGPLSPVFHAGGLGKKKKRNLDPGERAALEYPDRPESFGEAVRYPFALIRVLWKEGFEFRMMIVCVCGLILWFVVPRAEELKVVKRPSYVASFAAEHNGTQPTRLELLEELGPLEHNSKRMLMPRVEGRSLDQSRALATARIFAEVARQGASGVASVDEVVAQAQALAEHRDVSQEIAAATGAPPGAADMMPTLTPQTDVTVEEEAVGEDTGELDPILKLVPASMKKSMAVILRKTITGVHSVGLNWSEAEEAEAKARGVQCLLVESREGSGVQKVKRLLRTGYELTTTAEMEDQLRDHMETMRIGSGDESMDYIPMCIEM